MTLPFAVDWQAVGALGSAGAAIGAFVVLVFTARMARSSQRSAEAAVDAATGAWRPVLVPETFKVSHNGGKREAGVRVIARNIGRGAAVKVRMTIDGRGNVFEQYPAYIASPGATLEYGGLEIESGLAACVVLFTYQDIQWTLVLLGSTCGCVSTSTTSCAGEFGRGPGTSSRSTLRTLPRKRSGRRVVLVSAKRRL